jgi:hypothetical protein
MVLLGAGALSGCVAAGLDDAAATASTATATPGTPGTGGTGARAGGDTDSGTGRDASGTRLPDGATTDTPECQPASEAAVAAVNAAMTAPDHDPSAPPPVMTELTATADPDHAVWLLVGVYDRIANSEGHLVAWATAADPTLATFDGVLRSVGSGTATITSAPALQFPDVSAAGGFPEAALHCAAAG